MRSIVLIGLLVYSVLSYGQSWDSLNANGFKLYQAGNYVDAEKELQLALSFAKNEHGPDGNHYVTTLTNLAYVYKASGNYLKASGLFRLAILHTDATQSQSIDAIEARTNLANLFLDIGRYDSCELYLQEAVDILDLARKANQDQFSESAHALNMAYVTIQNSRASLKRRIGQLQEGVEILEQLLSYTKQTYPDQYDSLYTYRSMLSNLANYYMEMGALEKAKSMAIEYGRLVNMFESNSIAQLYALQNIANLYRLLDQLDSAIIVWKNALHIIQKGQYKGNEIHVSILSNLGELYSSMEEYDSAILILEEARRLNEERGAVNPRLYQTTLFNLAESYHWSLRYAEASKMYDLLTTHLLRDVIYNFTYLSETEKIAFYRNQRSVLDSYLFFALSISGAVPIQKSDNPHIDETITRKLYDLQIMTKGIILNASHKMKQLILESDDEVLKSEYRSWEGLKAELSNALKSDTPDSALVRKLEKSIEEAEIQLSRKSANFKRGFVVNAVSWRDVQQKLKPGEAAVEMIRFYDGLIYGALIVTSETTERPILAIIKSKENRYLEREYYRQYKNAIEYKITDTVSYDVYWRPIVTEIKKQLAKNKVLKRVYFSPDGIYNQINLNTLFDVQEQTYLIDQVEIYQLTNTKEIVQGDAQESSKKLENVILMGRPAFSLTKDDDHQVFTDLSGTGVEVDKINTVLQHNKVRTTVYKGVAASETTVKKLQHHSVLHLATHGFFDQVNEDGSVTNSLIRTLLNSGIVLAGANNPETLENGDGILTAYESLGLNLEFTQLVVLSACETGLGEFHPGEGVYGLRLALNAAGANASIMSLWKVDDEATQELMTKFYGLWLTKRGTLRASFRQAQRELRKIYAEPYFWGGFVLVGR